MPTDSAKSTAQNYYPKMREKLTAQRSQLGRPLTFSEKILFSHLSPAAAPGLIPGQSMLPLLPDRVVMQDATAQMALLQYGQAGIGRVAVPTTVHCDHLIRAHQGGQPDLQASLLENKEVFDFLASASKKYGIGFWKPGAGVIHQVFLEHYAFPGGLAIGTDSHTPNAGGLGMLACGVGGADAVDVMAGLAWELRTPELIGVHLTGELTGWAAPKDVILYLCGLLTTKGGTNKIIEYFGPGTRSLSCTGKATITNMGAEVGATSSLFPFDPRMAAYLRATGREELAVLAEKNQELLTADPEVEKDPARFFKQVIELDLSKLEPHVVGPHTPDLARSISRLAKEAREKGYPDKVSAVLIGSCTNSSYEDLGRAAQVAQQASQAGLKMAASFFVAPGSQGVFETVVRDGQLQALQNIGARVLANACGPCIGQWKREDGTKGTKNSILTTFNRNFPARNDGNIETCAFIASPEIALALGLAGTLSFNPLTDSLDLPNGKKLKLKAPQKVDEVPKKGFVKNDTGLVPPAEDGAAVNILIDPKSERLQLLKPFSAWHQEDFVNIPVLAKVKGKCTTDHISPAGPWLRYRGHLDHISDNLLSGAINAFSGETGMGHNVLSNDKSTPFHKTARAYQAAGLHWAIIGDENYGEGSSREHAAMSPRYLGAAVVLARSFARIHETNLKKQGILPLTFQDPADYEKILVSDRLNLKDPLKLAPGLTVEVIIKHEDATILTLQLNHSLSAEQIQWFLAGSALNALKQKKGEKNK